MDAESTSESGKWTHSRQDIWNRRAIKCGCVSRHSVCKAANWRVEIQGNQHLTPLIFESRNHWKPKIGKALKTAPSSEIVVHMKTCPLRNSQYSIQSPKIVCVWTCSLPSPSRQQVTSCCQLPYLFTEARLLFIHLPIMAITEFARYCVPKRSSSLQYSIDWAFLDSWRLEMTIAGETLACGIKQWRWNGCSRTSALFTAIQPTSRYSDKVLAVNTDL